MNQLRYECRCPHCGALSEPDLTQIHFSHCRFDTLPKMPKQWDKPRILTDTQLFTTLDGVTSPIYKCCMDIQGSRWYDAIDLCLAEPGRIIATAGPKEVPPNHRPRPAGEGER